MSLSTFSGLYIAKSGIRGARANLQVTGQNMANVNTEGYTKQSVLTSSIGPTGGSRIAGSNLQIGNGVDSNGLIQSRDSYLDIRYRQKNAVVGQTGTILNTLTSIDKKLDETVSNGINAQLSALISTLNSYQSTKAAGFEDNLKGTASKLTDTLHLAANNLASIKKETLDKLQKNSIETANQLLRDIASLNAEIKNSEISGSNALELKDRRNSMIDSLSKFANIEVSQTQIAVGVSSVNTMQIDLVSGDKKFSLVDDIHYNQFSLDTAGASVNIQLKTTGNPPADVTWHDPADATDKKLTNADVTLGEFGGYLTMLNGNGEYDTPATTRGISYYQNILDTMANKFAEIMNQANSSRSDIVDKPLFQASDGKPINASNIQLSEAWRSSSSSDNYFVATKSDGTTGTNGTSSAGNNIANIIGLLTKENPITTNSGTPLFSSSITGFMSTVVNSILAIQTSSIGNENSSAVSELDETDLERSSVSAVDINEEGINLIQYNHALSASSRFMSTINDMLDTIINKMGIV